jgi:deazaflavin-dependent oxidoreductase (nitroreductase family)
MASGAEKPMLPDANQPLMRALFKAPILFWRLGLDPLVNRRFVLISHTGRKSGLTRRVITEYVRLDDGRIAIVSGYGDAAQWYRNLMAVPAVTLQSNDGIAHVRAYRITDEGELQQVYARLMSASQPFLLAYLNSVGVPATLHDVLAQRDRLHFIAFSPTDERTPPPLDADLAWVPVAALLATLAGIGLMLLRRR